MGLLYNAKELIESPFEYFTHGEVKMFWRIVLSFSKNNRPILKTKLEWNTRRHKEKSSRIFQEFQVENHCIPHVGAHRLFNPVFSKLVQLNIIKKEKSGNRNKLKSPSKKNKKHPLYLFNDNMDPLMILKILERNLFEYEKPRIIKQEYAKIFEKLENKLPHKLFLPTSLLESFSVIEQNLNDYILNHHYESLKSEEEKRKINEAINGKEYLRKIKQILLNLEFPSIYPKKNDS